MLATVANLAIVVAMCMAVMVGAISTEAPEASPAMADTIAEEEYMAGVAEDERPQLCTPNLEFLHPPLVPYDITIHVKRYKSRTFYDYFIC